MTKKSISQYLIKSFITLSLNVIDRITALINMFTIMNLLYLENDKIYIYRYDQ